MSMTIDRPHVVQNELTQGIAATPARPMFLRQATDWLGAIGLLGVGYVHMLDVRGKLSEVPYLGVGYVLLIVTSVIAAGMIVRGNTKGWLLGGGAAAATFLGYCLSRTTGLPASTDDIGNWSETLGVWSLFLEGFVVVLAVGRFQAIVHSRSMRRDAPVEA